MPVGNYIIKETKAPDGYKITTEEIKITVKDTSKTQVFEIENEVIAPKTSMDYSKYILIIAIIQLIQLVRLYHHKIRLHILGHRALGDVLRQHILLIRAELLLVEPSVRH